MTILIIIAALILIILLTVNIPVKAVIKFYGAHAYITVNFLFFKLYPKKDKEDGKAKIPKREKKGRLRTENKSPPENDSLEDFSVENEELTENIPEEDTFPVKKEGLFRKKLSRKETSDKQTGDDDKDDTEETEKPSLLEKIDGALDRLSELTETVSLICELILDPLKKFAGKIRLTGIVIDFAAADEDAAKAAVSYGRLCAAVYNSIAFIASLTDISVKSVNVDCLYNTPSYKSRYNGELTVKLRPASLLNALSAVAFEYLFHRKKYAPVMELLQSAKK